MSARTRIAAAVVTAAAVLLTGCSALTGLDSDPAPAGTGSVSAVGPPPAAAERPVARPVVTPCTKNRRPQWIVVSLKRQHMWMCERGRVAKDVPITSGMTGPYTETPTGRYRIQGLNRNTTLTLNTGATYPVKFWIPFDAPLFGFHDSSWQHFPYGSAKYKTAGSHGCVHVPLAAIRFMYRWADVGTPLIIKA
jgi:L,D-transpeptidase-like protein